MIDSLVKDVPTRKILHVKYNARAVHQLGGVPGAVQQVGYEHHGTNARSVAREADKYLYGMVGMEW